MAPNIWLGLLIVLPAFLIIFLRSNAAVVFLSLCAGAVLERYMSDTATLAAATISSRSNSTALVHIGLLLLPALLSLVILRKSISTSKTLVNIFPAISVGLVTALLIVPLLPLNTQVNVQLSDTWRILENYQEIIIGGSTLLAIVVLWLTKGKSPHHKKKHH